MTADDREQLAERVRVYRGVSYAGDRKGVHWTTSYAAARGFAVAPKADFLREFHRDRPGMSRVMVASVPRDRILALFHRGGPGDTYVIRKTTEIPHHVEIIAHPRSVDVERVERVAVGSPSIAARVFGGFGVPRGAVR